MEFMMYYWLDDPRHKEDAFIYFQGLAYANGSLPEHMVKDRNAEVMCGVMKRSGIGTYKDLQEAIGWFSIAARDGYADAQYYLGQMYEYGEGAAVDHEDLNGDGREDRLYLLIEGAFYTVKEIYG